MGAGGGRDRSAEWLRGEIRTVEQKVSELKAGGVSSDDTDLLAVLDDRLTVLRSDVEIGALDSDQWTAAQLSEVFAQRLEILTGPRSRMIKRILGGAPTKAELEVVLTRYGSSITAITVELDKLGDVPEELAYRELIDLVGNDVEFWQWRYWRWVNEPHGTKDEMAQEVLTNRLTMVKSVLLNDRIDKAGVLERAEDLYEVLNQPGRGGSSYGHRLPWVIRGTDLIKKRIELANIIQVDPFFSGEQQAGGDLGASVDEDHVLKLYQEITKLDVQLVADGFFVSVDVIDELEYDLEIVRNLQLPSPETKNRIRDWIIPHYIDVVIAGIARDELGFSSSETAGMLLIVSQAVRIQVAALVRRGTFPGGLRREGEYPPQAPEFARFTGEEGDIVVGPGGQRPTVRRQSVRQ